MVFIVIGTTPTITYNFKVVSPSDFRTCILTIKCNGQILIEKTLADAEIGTMTNNGGVTGTISTKAVSALAQAYTQDGYGVHPNEQGYRLFYVPKITAWMKGL